MFPRTPAAAAFRSLERVLVRRRLLGVDLRLRLELLALAGLLGGFLFWQARIPLDGLLRMRGEGAVAAAVLATLLAMAALGGLIAGSRHAVRLRRARRDDRGPAARSHPGSRGNCSPGCDRSPQVPCGVCYGHGWDQ